MPAAPEERAAPLWLSHHPPDRHDRCVLVAGRPVCRRCLVLYPLAVGVAVVALVAAPALTAPWLLVVLPLPAVVDWWLEHLGRLRPSPARLVAVTVPLAVGLGAGFARYLDDPLDPWFWAMVLVYGGSCLGIALWRFLDEHAP